MNNNLYNALQVRANASVHLSNANHALLSLYYAKSNLLKNHLMKIAQREFSLYELNMAFSKGFVNVNQHA